MLFSIKDIKSGNFGPLLDAPTHAHMMRTIHELFMSKRNSDNLMVKYPEDFVLYKVGDFDSTTGIVTSVPEISQVCYIQEIALDARRTLNPDDKELASVG